MKGLVVGVLEVVGKELEVLGVEHLQQLQLAGVVEILMHFILVELLYPQEHTVVYLFHQQ